MTFIRGVALGPGDEERTDAGGWVAVAVDLSDFSVVDADAEASGASKVTVNLSSELDAVASGASHIK